METNNTETADGSKELNKKRKLSESNTTDGTTSTQTDGDSTRTVERTIEDNTIQEEQRREDVGATAGAVDPSLASSPFLDVLTQTRRASMAQQSSPYPTRNITARHLSDTPTEASHQNALTISGEDRRQQQIREQWLLQLLALRQIAGANETERSFIQRSSTGGLPDALRYLHIQAHLNRNSVSQEFLARIPMQVQVQDMLRTILVLGEAGRNQQRTAALLRAFQSSITTTPQDPHQLSAVLASMDLLFVGPILNANPETTASSYFEQPAHTRQSRSAPPAAFEGYLPQALDISSTSSLAASASTSGSQESVVVREESNLVSRTASDDCTNAKSISVALEGDKDVLSKYQCLIRKQLCLFEATAQDVRRSAKGRTRQLVLGQVGIGCKHCYGLEASARPMGAVYFSGRPSGIYQTAQNIVSNHFLVNCTRLPEDVREEIRDLKSSKERAWGGGKNYWLSGIKVLGIVEQGGHLFFDKGRHLQE